MKKKTASERIAEWFALRDLRFPGAWYALHEFTIEGVSENAKAARMREMTRADKLEVRFREGHNFKEWRLKDEAPKREPEDYD